MHLELTVTLPDCQQSKSNVLIDLVPKVWIGQSFVPVISIDTTIQSSLSIEIWNWSVKSLIDKSYGDLTWGNCE